MLGENMIPSINKLNNMYSGKNHLITEVFFECVDFNLLLFICINSGWT